MSLDFDKFTQQARQAFPTTVAHSQAKEPEVDAPVAPLAVHGLRYKSAIRDGHLSFSVALAGVHESDVAVLIKSDQIKVSAVFHEEHESFIREFVYDLDTEKTKSGLEVLEFGLIPLNPSLVRGILQFSVKIRTSGEDLEQLTLLTF